MGDKFKDVIARHPLPWRVTDAYKEWNVSGGHSANPPAIVDALYQDDLDRDEVEYSVIAENDKHIVVTSSEWLNMDVDAAEFMVAAVNGTAA
ncbi:hypothetical protein [Mesorhizobium sp. B263B2A]|uniref:hypothetical protein n=1 Tax=Mesorhizobium sp. B263B2A TaxID=2876669 RepID=UPI001CD15C00|nr:hypothetical protein [Mesorhizobium sp. B263B2A]MCA0032738.1 hypothetical protein [Mesorhizobium sp. B263B2A]